MKPTKKQILFSSMALALSLGLASMASAAGSLKLEDNSLVKGMTEDRIFAVRGGALEPIHSLDELRREHAGQAIHKIADDDLAKMPVLGEDNPARLFDDNSLVKDAQDKKIFLITKSERKHVKSLGELAELRREHASAKTIKTVSHEVVSAIPRVMEDNPARALDDNSLVRSSSGRIFLVRHGELEPIHDMTELRREHAGQRINGIEDNVLRGLAIRGEDNPSRVGDDNLPRHSGLDDGSSATRPFDDNLPRHSGVDNAPGGSGEIGSGRDSSSGSGSDD